MGAVLAGGVFVADADHLIHMYIPFMPCVNPWTGFECISMYVEARLHL